LLLEESTTEVEFEAYMDHLFTAVAPGRNLILGIADTTPPGALFDRLVRIGERVEREGRLPLEAGAARAITEGLIDHPTDRPVRDLAEDRVFRIIQEDVLSGRHTDIKAHARELLEEGCKAQDILQRGMMSAMEVIGDRFKAGDVFIPEVLLSARAMNEALSVLEPHLSGDETKAGGKILIGTVHGDLHDIGKNMVITMLRGVGFEIEDMGINVPTSRIVQLVEESRPDILGLSALLTTTMHEMKKVIDALEAKGIRESVMIMVGGAPVNEKFARDIGADGYARDAGDAVALARRMISGGIWET
jgi:5-methyltetrahydrofolate--homocysteine methyltransferase